MQKHCNPHPPKNLPLPFFLTMQNILVLVLWRTLYFSLRFMDLILNEIYKQTKHCCCLDKKHLMFKQKEHCPKMS